MSDVDDLEVLEDLVVLRMMMKRRQGNRQLFKSRESTGVNILIEKNPDLFFKSTSMDHEQLYVLLNLVKPWLRKYSRRKPIAPEQRLYITLHYLAHGSALHVLSMKFRIGLETARCIIIETCEVLWSVLGSSYAEEWVKIAEDFYRATNLPHCIGAIDGKHVRITCPPNSGSQYFNYKKFNSIVLHAACDSNSH